MPSLRQITSIELPGSSLERLSLAARIRRIGVSLNDKPEPPEREQMVRLALAVEGGLILLAGVLSWLLRLPVTENLQRSSPSKPPPGQNSGDSAV